MRITEGQLRRIIRQEVQALREAPRRPSAALHAGGSGARGLPIALELGRLPLTPDEEFEFEDGGMSTLDALDDALQDIPRYRRSRVDSVKDLRGASPKAMLLRALWRERYGPGLAPA
jgi:hypothetical protein